MVWLLSVGVAVSWLVALVVGRVPLDYLGDESARLLRSYGVSSPSGVVGALMSGDRWTAIHPPGDVAFKGAVNWVARPVLDQPSDFVQLHQILAWACVVGGVGLCAVGARNRWGNTAATVVIGLSISSSPVIYVAHHTVGEALAVLLVGVGVCRALSVPMDTPSAALLAGLPILAAASVRPEAGVVFIALALLPLFDRRWSPALVFGALAVAPIVFVTVLLEFSSGEESYASIRRFPRAGLLEVVTDTRMREIIWGVGVLPYAGVAIVVLAGVSLRRSGLTLPVALVGAWLVVAAVFTQQIAVGAVHQQERAYLFPALLGILAVSGVIGEWPCRSRGASGVMAGVLSALVVVNAWTLWSTTYGRWSDRVPDDAVAVGDYLDGNSSDADAVLLDWMWWQEWRAAVYASEPGLPGAFCTYLDCVVEPDESLGELAPDGYDGDRDRLVNAATFLREERPRHIVGFSEGRYEDWLAWRQGQEPFPSFVRPLLVPDGECFETRPELGATRYCPALTNDSYVVLERVDG